MPASLNPFTFWLGLSGMAPSWFVGAAPAPHATGSTRGSFTRGVCPEGTYALFLPPPSRNPLSLLVMLHGCSQTGEDFAAATAMNEAAADAGFAVLYPAQSARANAHLCWNWFQPSHQQRGRGEPAMLAAMTLAVIGAHRIDRRRVYVAGLSAGGAMAAVLGEAYPDIFAAVGVHSGVATQVAIDASTALAAMRGVGNASCDTPTGVATIVFHGDADDTVHPSNVARLMAACAGNDVVIDHQRIEEGGRESTRTRYKTQDGTVIAEHWNVHGARHAWSGGSGEGSFADERGPDASARMLQFFKAHPRPPESDDRSSTGLCDVRG
ncbi:PHB depolymerase family esterase [Variovorax sp. UMC13]|uniref:extracellular catalytic domain type 1 short-chain-length polyhydroxyalkanoate depolymerase n=1 Tax=Variovorax sp. UMC13 TaxID=1862326 RepID=UPI00160078F1|nr:PHB depolymerase family esterase [Variovorax sp. UMC13]